MYCAFVNPIPLLWCWLRDLKFKSSLLPTAPRSLNISPAPGRRTMRWVVAFPPYAHLTCLPPSQWPKFCQSRTCLRQQEVGAPTATVLEIQSHAYPADIPSRFACLPHAPWSPVCPRGLSEFCNIWPPRVVVVTPGLVWPNHPVIHSVWIRAQKGWEIRSQHWMSWIRWTALPPTTCTPRWHQTTTDRCPHFNPIDKPNWSVDGMSTPSILDSGACKDCVWFVNTR